MFVPQDGMPNKTGYTEIRPNQFCSTARPFVVTDLQHSLEPSQEVSGVSACCPLTEGNVPTYLVITRCKISQLGPATVPASSDGGCCATCCTAIGLPSGRASLPHLGCSTPHPAHRGRLIHLEARHRLRASGRDGRQQTPLAALTPRGWTPAAGAALVVVVTDDPGWLPACPQLRAQREGRLLEARAAWGAAALARQRRLRGRTTDSMSVSAMLAAGAARRHRLLPALWALPRSAVRCAPFASCRRRWLRRAMNRWQRGFGWCSSGTCMGRMGGTNGTRRSRDDR
eukprot:366450-Chlamydomonas_euryale.AAC.33